MGKLNYTNRKIEGIKLGQVIAKDLIKRIPPSTGSKAAFRDPIVELDASGRALTSEGLYEVASALTKSISYEDDNGKVVRLEELCLRDNKLEIRSLPHLSQIISLAAHDLRDLDLSENVITVTTDDEVRLWEDFLTSFSDCCVLRRIDLSGNPLGHRAFEVLARVYGRQKSVDLAPANNLAESLEMSTRGSKNVSPIQTRDELEKRARKLSLASNSEKDKPGADTMSLAAVNQEESSWHGFKTPEKPASVVNHPEALEIYATTRGLRSVPYLILSNTEMTETCALHLSYVVATHNMPERLLTRVPAAKGGPPSQHLLAYDNETRCRGIVYLPNSHLGTPAMKVLDLSEAVREGSFDDIDQEENPEATTPMLKLANATRRISDTRGVATGRRRSTLSTGSADHGRQTDRNSISVELDRARSRIQGNALQELGPRSNDLWRVALKMLTLSRDIRPAIKKQQRHVGHRNRDDSGLPALPDTDSRALRSSSSSRTPLAAGKPNLQITTPLFGQWRLDNSRLVPVVDDKPFSAKTSPPANPVSPAKPPSPANLRSLENSLTPTIPKAPYRTQLPCGFPKEVWARIMAAAVGAEDIMSETQQRSVLQWAMDRGTLGRERESLGLKESAQIWKVLEGTGCLAYEMKS